MNVKFYALMLASLFIGETAFAAETILVNPATILSTAERIDFKGKNVFAVEKTSRGNALRSTPDASASGLYQEVNLEGAALTNIHWSWIVEKLQPNVDIRKVETEDFGATVFFVFGKPSMFNKDVPTLAYTWTGTPVKNGSVIQSNRFKTLKYMQLHGFAEVGTWQEEQRNVAADYRAVFGKEPPTLKYIAIFNDNDQTKAPVTALFGAIKSVN